MQTQQLPEKFLERLPTYVPQDKLPMVLASFAQEQKITFRTNTIKATSKIVRNELISLGFEIKQLPWYSDGFMLMNNSKEELMNTSLYKNNAIYIQNASSMIPALVLHPQNGETILDMAASPGSKTTQLASLMQNTGTIIANDKSPKRLFKLIANLKEQGVNNTRTSAIPGEFLWKRFPEYFDRVLIDAPCTMEGRIKINQPDSYKDWSPRKIKELSNLQKWLLRSAISCTKVGGTIVYSTCAMSPEENEDVVDWILTKMKEAVTLVDITIPLLPESKGLTVWKNKVFSAQLAKTIRIYPDTTMEGFFIAVFTKHSSSITY